MSKFLKFIVHFVIICTIILILGMALPPFFGVSTVIVDSSDKVTNLPMGSVTYAIPVRTCNNFSWWSCGREHSGDEHLTWETASSPGNTKAWKIC